MFCWTLMYPITPRYDTREHVLLTFGTTLITSPQTTAEIPSSHIFWWATSTQGTTFHQIWHGVSNNHPASLKSVHTVMTITTKTQQRIHKSKLRVCMISIRWKTSQHVSAQRDLNILITKALSRYCRTRSIFLLSWKQRKTSKFLAFIFWQVMAPTQRHTHMQTPSCMTYDIYRIPEMKAALRNATSAVRSSTCIGNRNVSTSNVNMLRIKLSAVAILSYKLSFVQRLKQNKCHFTINNSCFCTYSLHLQVRMCNHPHPLRWTLLIQQAAY